LAVGVVLMLVGVSGLVAWGRRGETEPARGPTRGQVAFLTLLVVAGLGLAGATVVRALTTTPATPDLAEEVKAYLRKRQVQPLSGALERLLVNPDSFRVKSQVLPLVGDTAPDFELSDHRGNKWHLQAQLEKGPVVVIFYYGFFCDHCVSQLFDVAQDIRYFRELGAEVVAISVDTPETTRKQFQRYGAFDFPVLSDPDNKVAQAYGVFTPAEGDKDSDLQHGTFVIDREGTVQWGYAGPVPFTGNRTLLYQIAKIEDRLPAEKPANGP
jgi:peroxiredoxin